MKTIKTIVFPGIFVISFLALACSGFCLIWLGFFFHYPHEIVMEEKKRSRIEEIRCTFFHEEMEELEKKKMKKEREKRKERKKMQVL